MARCGPLAFCGPSVVLEFVLIQRFHAGSLATLCRSAKADSQFRADIGNPGLALLGYQTEVNPAFARSEAAVPIENPLHSVEISESTQLLPHLMFGCHQRSPDGQRPNLRVPVGDRVIDPAQLQR